MPFTVSIDDARKAFPEYTFVAALTASEQKCAFHVRRDGQDLCLKIISPSSEADRLEREIQALLKVNHPNIVEFFEYTFSVRKGAGARHFVVEKFIPGADLDVSSVWEEARVVSFFSLLASGLQELKKNALVHRDLKPSNIRVHTSGHPVVIDLGLARDLTLPDLTQTGVGVGTPLYFAPEQWDGRKRDIDHRTDLFALGILMYQAFTGRHPFYANQMSVAELKRAACDSDDHLSCAAFTALKPAAQILLKKLLSRPVEQRPIDAAQVITILSKLGGSS